MPVPATQPSPTPLRILLGVTGGIAAYKSAELTRRFKERNADVQVVMTAGAQQFVTPLTFQALSGLPGVDGFSYSGCSARAGLSLDARHAGNIVASPAIPRTTTMAAVSMSGSEARTA